jgi:hypothetical protein
MYRISTPYLTGCSAQRVSLGVHLGISSAAVNGRVRHPFRKPKVDHCVSEGGSKEGRKGLRRETRDGRRVGRRVEGVGWRVEGIKVLKYITSNIAGCMTEQQVKIVLSVLERANGI